MTKHVCVVKRFSKNNKSKNNKSKNNKTKNNNKKKRITKKRITKKNTKKFFGGTIKEIEDLVPTEQKTIVLMGEIHEHERNNTDYNMIIKKQKKIIDLLNAKYNGHLYFYTEAPNSIKNRVLKDTLISSSIVAQYANSLMRIKFSSLDVCDRKDSSCDDAYADDILDIFSKNPDVTCVVVAVGLLHLPELKKELNMMSPDTKVICVNTISREQLKKVFPALFEAKKYDFIRFLQKDEPTFDLTDSARETFLTEVLHNKDNKKIYRCPICKTVTGTYAPLHPEETSYFSHNHNCPNIDKIPIEN
jgi:hypothetical protein